MAAKRIKDELFGDLVLDDQSNVYQTTSEPVPGRKIGIYVDPDDLKIEDALPICRQIFRKLDLKKVRAKASEQLIDLYNSTWSDGETLTVDEFKGRIRLDSVKVSPYGAEVYWDDNDLFWGHTIIVSIDKDGNVLNSEIAG